MVLFLGIFCSFTVFYPSNFFSNFYKYYIVSGHGGQVADKDGDEDDGYDETILPVDFQQAGQITDDEMVKVL